MAQVHNRVNAGIMDAVTCGGMCEAAEPEDEEYEIGMEDDGLEPYGHVVKESTDSVSFDGGRLTCYDSDAVPFVSFVKKDGSSTRIFVGENGELHSTIRAALLSNGDIKKEDFGSLWDIRADESRSGRVWIMDDCTVISFYSYGAGFVASPKNLRKIYDSCVEALLAVQEKTGTHFNIGETMVDLWTFDAHSTVIVPVRWFNNGVLEVYAPYMKSCNPVKNFTDEYEYELKTTRGTFRLDWRGDEVEKEEASYELNESKDLKNKNSYPVYIKSFIDFLREQHLNIDPLPKIELKMDEQEGLFIKTGYYDPNEMKVVAYIDGRHPKDVMRTIAHEFVHHMQNIQNPERDWGSNGDLMQDRQLRGIEGEAFLLGNILFREWTEKMKKEGTLSESKGSIDEITAELVEPDDVDLSSFNIKKRLNPKFWDDGHLDTRIRLKLLDIADDFFDSLGIDWVEPEDVIITGSLANYNWNDKYSDIDLHILVDYEDVDERTDFVRDFFTLKKNEWNQKHKGLKIFGFPVEVYVQDANEPHASSGVYSIDRDEWITEPDRDKIRSGKVDKRHIREMISTYMNKIDCLIDIYKHHKDDKHEMEQVAKDAAEMLDEIKAVRKDDLAKYGREMCDGNIIFKALRRADYIGKLIKLKNLAYDKLNSL